MFFVLLSELFFQKYIFLLYDIKCTSFARNDPFAEQLIFEEEVINQHFLISS